MSEEKEVKPTQEEQQETGWRGVQMTPLTPIGDIISFLNVLNQRLATIEDFVFIIHIINTHGFIGCQRFLINLYLPTSTASLRTLVCNTFELFIIIWI